MSQQVKADEGLRLKPYRDTVNKLTIGYGRNLDDVGISPEEARLMLEADLRRAEADCVRTFDFYVSLGGERQAVLVNMCFNLGLTRLLSFRRALSAIRSREWARAAAEMLDSKWAEQVGTRAQRLARQMESGVFQ